MPEDFQDRPSCRTAAPYIYENWSGLSSSVSVFMFFILRRRLLSCVVYRIDPHATSQHQIRMKILIQGSMSPNISRKRKN